MIVDTKNGTIDITIIFEKPLNDYLKEQLDYILDTISELESDYDFARGQYEKPKRLG
ncbi:hypothetical protein [Flavobacterium sp.]|jgi:hypothetical protein|uniref:hypothetical protein n=1 Tax=Flavobacterium sp. TaxID=239 RepID=UPI0037BFC59F